MTLETELIINNPMGTAFAADISQEQTSVTFPNTSQTALAWKDISEGIKGWRIWLMLAYQDIKLRYRRSILGPFWITLSMAITVYSMGYLYSHLFRMNVYEYFPYLVAGMLGWSLLSTTVTDLIDTFTQSNEMIKQIKLPYSLYLHKVAARNVIIFFHNLLVIVPVLIIFHTSATVNLNLLMLIPGLLIIYFNAICYGIVLSMIGARYRDISQIIKSLIQVIFFLTPIMWTPDILPEGKRFIALLNPFYSLIEMLRAPLIGKMPTLSNFIIVSIITLIGMAASYYMFSSRRARIVYWI